jgi:hypothetical protein
MKWRLTIRWSRPEIQPDLSRVGVCSEVRSVNTSTTAQVKTPVLDEGTGCRRAPEAEHSYQLRVMGREAVVAVTNGRLDFGTWERIFYGVDGRRRKRVLVKIIGE